MVNIVVNAAMTIELFSITVQGHTILATNVHSHPVVCETLYSVCVGGGGGGGVGGEGEREGGRGREREREGEREGERKHHLNAHCIHITNDLFTCVG